MNFDLSLDALDLREDGLSADFLRLGDGETTAVRLESGLVRAGVIGATERLNTFVDVTTWHQGGAETFVGDSYLNTDRVWRRHIVGKALFSFAVTPERMLDSWLSRRETLRLIGVRVPILYAAFAGTLYEEYIESELFERSLCSETLTTDVARTAALVDRAGFESLSFLSDLRTQNEKAYYVDFGFDLGDPTGVPNKRARSSLGKALCEPFRTACLKQYDSCLL
jgi:hypothetical protein